MGYFELRKQLKSIPVWHLVELHYEWPGQQFETADEVYLIMPGKNGKRFVYIHGRVQDGPYKSLPSDYEQMADDIDMDHLVDIMDHGLFEDVNLDGSV